MPGVLYARVNNAWVPITTSGGGGASEVEIGTDDPISTNAAAELWYDTDDDTVAGPTAVAGNSLGIIATGSFTFGDGANLTNGAAMVYPISVMMVLGRRYRLRMGVRALSPPGGGNAYASVQFQKDNVTQGDRYIQIIGTLGYVKFETEWTYEGDGLQHSWGILWSCPYTITGYSSGGYWYIEDCGPNTSPALPVPPTPPAWNQVTFQNGWVNNGLMPSYRRIGDIVYLRGNMNGGSATAGSVAFTLPVGFRPPANMNFPVVAGNSALSFVTIQTTGACFLAAAAVKDWMAWDGINFSVTP